MDADALVVGAGLAGLVAAYELADAGRSVVLLDQESEANLGGQAWWSFGGLFLVDSPEQRRMGIKDTFDLAWQDWEGTAGWDRRRGRLGRASGVAPTSNGRPARSGRGCASSASVLPRRRVGRAWRRSRGRARQLRAAVPHPVGDWDRCRRRRSSDRVRAHIAAGRIIYRPRHRVDELVTTGGAVTGVRGSVLAAGQLAPRASPANRDVVGDFEYGCARRHRHHVAASAATTTSCGPTGPTASAPRPST